MTDQIPLLPSEPKPDTAHDLVAWFVDEAHAKGATVPKRVVGQTAKAVKDLLDEGVSADHVRAGLARLLDRNMIQPSLLPQLVTEATSAVKEQFQRTAPSRLPDDNSHLEKYFDGAIDEAERKKVAEEARRLSRSFGRMQ